jgi:predicted metal-dependent HD superfamily phosphohydrolase
MFNFLIEKYTEEYRHYHNIEHILSLLCEFESAHPLSIYPLRVKMALWFHDIIYVPRSKTNEIERSEMAYKRILKLGLSEEFAKYVADLILLTRHDILPENMDGKLTVDVDLAILGKPQQIFDYYEETIRKEYSHLPETVYKKKRAKILKGFLEREYIYQTVFFRELYEEQARRNLTRTLDSLPKDP